MSDVRDGEMITNSFTKRQRRMPILRLLQFIRNKVRWRRWVESAKAVLPLVDALDRSRRFYNMMYYG